MPRCKAYPTGPPFPPAVLDVRPWWDVMIVVSNVFRIKNYMGADAYSMIMLLGDRLIGDWAFFLVLTSIRITLWMCSGRRFYPPTHTSPFSILHLNWLCCCSNAVHIHYDGSLQVKLKNDIIVASVGCGPHALYSNPERYVISATTVQVYMTRIVACTILCMVVVHGNQMYTMHDLFQSEKKKNNCQRCADVFHRVSDRVIHSCIREKGKGSWYVYLYNRNKLRLKKGKDLDIFT